MKLYWTMNSVPELRDLPRAERRRVWHTAWRLAGGMSVREIAVLGLALALGGTIGLLGLALCVGIVAVPIFSRIVERLRPTILSVRRELGLGAPIPTAIT
jgi:hypothetical protein